MRSTKEVKHKLTSFYKNFYNVTDLEKFAHLSYKTISQSSFKLFILILFYLSILARNISHLIQSCKEKDTISSIEYGIEIGLQVLAYTIEFIFLLKDLCKNIRGNLLIFSFEVGVLFELGREGRIYGKPTIDFPSI